jgi:phosphoribosylformylglycinamidine synthase
MSQPRVIVLRAPGTNCDEETVAAWELAGAVTETWHVGRLLETPGALDEFQVLTLPGGFSYGDDLGAGRILATRLGLVVGEALRRFHERGGLILGICNGFQVLVKAGLLPGGPGPVGGGAAAAATLTHNAAGHFESRWVRLGQVPGRSPFVTGSEPIELPVAHGEGRFLLAEPAQFAALEAAGQVVLRYVDDSGRPTQEYPANPNGSPGAVAGLCDPTGRIFGLMPHPERFVDRLQHPRWTRRDPRPGEEQGDGLRIFRDAVAALRSA